MIFLEVFTMLYLEYMYTLFLCSIYKKMQHSILDNVRDIKKNKNMMQGKEY